MRLGRLEALLEALLSLRTSIGGIRGPLEPQQRLALACNGAIRALRPSKPLRALG